MTFGLIQGGEEALTDTKNPRLVIWFYKDSSTPRQVFEKLYDSRFFVNP
jgi:hypothetical protein